MDHQKVDILYYDGVCALCNGAVKFFLKRHPTVRFAPLQGQTAAQRLPLAWRESISTVVLEQDGHFITEAAVTVELLKKGPAAWPALGSLIGLFPTGFSNRVYRFIAKNRYQWFGRYEACPLPPSGQAHSFLP